MTSIEIIRDLAATTIDRQKDQLDLMLQLVDDQDQLCVTMLCLCGAVGSAAEMLARNHRNSCGKLLDDEDAVAAVIGKLASVLLTKKTE